jgi:hypothetical protein
MHEFLDRDFEAKEHTTPEAGLFKPAISQCVSVVFPHLLSLKLDDYKKQFDRV